MASFSRPTQFFPNRWWKIGIGAKQSSIHKAHSNFTFFCVSTCSINFASLCHCFFTRIREIKVGNVFMFRRSSKIFHKTWLVISTWIRSEQLVPAIEKVSSFVFHERLRETDHFSNRRTCDVKLSTPHSRHVIYRRCSIWLKNFIWKTFKAALRPAKFGEERVMRFWIL